MITYTRSDATMQRLFDKVLSDNHQALEEHKLKIDIQVWEGAEGVCGIKEGGYETFGKIIIFGEDKRKGGSPDLRVCIDAKTWKDSNADQRRGIFDTLLERVMIRTTKDGEVIRDSAGRPKLKRRKHDLRMAGFKACVERNGADSVEARVFAGIQPSFKQMKLPFGEALVTVVPTEEPADAEAEDDDDKEEKE